MHDSKLEKEGTSLNVEVDLDKVVSHNREKENTMGKKVLKYEVTNKQKEAHEQRLEYQEYDNNRFYYMGKEHAFSEVLDVIDRLDEPEVLTPDWIKDNQLLYPSVHGITYHVPADKLYGLVLPKQEVLVSKIGELKPVVPQVVANWMEKYIDYGYDLYPALKEMENNSRSWTKVYEWYRENTFEFVVAYLTKEYEVEKEQKYRVELPDPEKNSNKVVLMRTQDGRVVINKVKEKHFYEKDATELTEDEIKRNHEYLWTFAKPVEEEKK